MIFVHKIAFYNFQLPVIFMSYLAIDIPVNKETITSFEYKVPFHGLRPIPSFPLPLPVFLGSCGCVKVEGVERGLGSK